MATFVPDLGHRVGAESVTDQLITDYPGRHPWPTIVLTQISRDNTNVDAFMRHHLIY